MTIGAELRKPGVKSSIVLVAASQRKLPLIIFCAQCVVRWCSFVFYKSKLLFTLILANEELLKSANGNSRRFRFRVDSGKRPLLSVMLTGQSSWDEVHRFAIPFLPCLTDSQCNSSRKRMVGV